MSRDGDSLSYFFNFKIVLTDFIYSYETLAILLQLSRRITYGIPTSLRKAR
jgi:hypothetical protein